MSIEAPTIYGNDFSLETDNRIASLNERLSGMDAQGRIRWAFRTFGPEVTLTTSGGEYSGILPPFVRAVCGDSPPFNVVFVDTLLYDQSTLDFIEKMREDGKSDGYNVITFKPLKTLEEVRDEFPEWEVDGTRHNKEARDILKVEPLNRAFRQLGTQIWLSGLMGWKSDFRAKLPVFKERENGPDALYPIIDWPKSAAERYIAANKLRTNRKHWDFFRGADQRSECGMHT